MHICIVGKRVSSDAVMRLFRKVDLLLIISVTEIRFCRQTLTSDMILILTCYTP